jgi:hypothetical protein
MRAAHRIYHVQTLPEDRAVRALEKPMPSIFTTTQVLDAIRTGAAKPDYARIALSNESHEGEVLMFADALKVNGVRTSVSATLQQQIADALGCLLLTPKLADILWQHRTAPLLPITGDVVTRTDEQQSAAIDAALALTSAGDDAIVQTVGKHWVISNTLLSHPGKAENYGWHFPGATWAGQSWEAAVTPGLRVVQGQGWAHDPSHLDYSQNCVLVHRACTFDGQARDLAEVLQDPTLAPLVSHEGPLKVLRQPGTAILACIIPDTFGEHIAAPPPGAMLCPTPPKPARSIWPAVWIGLGLAGLGAAAYGLLSRTR